MPETLADTGPILHLHEIGRLSSLSAVAPLVLPDLVVQELQAYHLDLSLLHEAGIRTAVRKIEREEWLQASRNPDLSQIQPADAQVFLLAEANQFRDLVLTDDLALRRLLEGRGGTVVGSVGLLVRTYSAGRIDRHELEGAVDDLANRSSLHMSRAFRIFLKNLLSGLL